MSEMYKCSNCGAEYDKEKTECPYCGYINEEGAEKEYMDRLYDVRDNLDVVDEAAAADYGKGYGRVLKIVGLTLLVLALVAGIIYTSRIMMNKRNEEEGLKKSQDMLEQMTWKKENFKIFDGLYEDGKYEELCEALVDSIDQGHEVYDWEHYDFAMVYNYYLSTVASLNRVDEKGWNEYEAGDTLYHCCLFYYDDIFKSSFYYKLSDEDMEILKPVYEYMGTVLHERMGFSDEEMNELKDSLLNEYGYPEYKKCEKVAKEYIGRYK